MLDCLGSGEGSEAEQYREGEGPPAATEEPAVNPEKLAYILIGVSKPL